MAKKPTVRSKAKAPARKAAAPRKPITLDAMTVFRAEAQSQKSKVQDLFKTADGFDNFVSRIGLRNDNALSAGTYEFNLITRNRIKLEAAYRGSWVVGAVVDSIAEDMTRAGLEINVAKDDGDVRKIQASISRLQLWQSICDGIKWGRLYGGGIGVIQIEGQDLSTPLDVETISKGQFRGVVVFDRWMVNPVIQDPIDSGPDMGLPSYYDIVNSPDEMSASYKPTSIDGRRVHYTRLIRFGGIKLPYFQAITEQMWDESVLERLWDRLISFDNATMSSASLIDRANLRTVQIENLREVLAAGAEATQGLYAQFDMMRELQVNEGLTLLDKNDVFSSTAYSFAGLSDMLLQFGQQLAGASEIPLVRLFGQSPAGLSATGDADMRMYYDNINARQESKLRNGWETLLKVLWYSELGKASPDDLSFTFKPLWQMSAVDRANNAKTTTETILGAYDSGVTRRATTLLELRDASADTGVFSNITDDDIEEADQDEPPMPDVDPGAAPGDPAAEKEAAPPGAPKTPVPALDAFKESEHPRKDDGEFGTGGGGGGTSSESDIKVEKKEGVKVNKEDMDATIDLLLSSVDDKHYDQFMGAVESEFKKAAVGEISPEDAKKIHRSHNYSFESDPDNEGMHKGTKNKRGKEVRDPSILIRMDGKLYAIDGQHRLSRAIKNGEPSNVAIIDGDKLKKYGIEKRLSGKKVFKDAKRPWWKRPWA